VRNARRAALLPVAVAVGGVLLAGAPAYARVTATWSKPTDGSVFTTTSPVDFAVALDRGSSLLSAGDGAAVNLTVTVPGPQPGPYTVDTSTGTSDRDLGFSLKPTCQSWTAGGCGQGAVPAYNGRYTAALTGGATGSRTVVLQVPPTAPTGVTATATGQHRVKIAWSANAEPDLTGYDVYTAQGASIVTNLPTGQLSYEFDLPSSGYGGEHSYVVRAHRLTCGNCDGSTSQLDSPFSDAASVTLTEPTPPPGGGDGGNGGGNGTGGNGSGNGGDTTGGGYNGGDTTGSGGDTTGGDSTGGDPSGGTGGSGDDGYNGSNTGGRFSSGGNTPAATAAQQRTAFGLTFKSFSPKLGAPKLPPLPKFAAPTVTIPEGTYDPLLEYGEQTVVVPDKVASGGGVTSMLVDSLTTAFEGRKLYRSIAMALLLLLAAGHLRLWLRHEPTA
jgi:hypothetical protein